MNFIESFNNKTILIPLLQRDYVQGDRKSAVISPFLDALLEKECDLNYIYGYEENGCFVPVDGQQRLTTLWLLYLYLYAKQHKTSEYKVRMKFASREYAGDFCDRLHEHLEDLLSKVTIGTPLDEAIIDQNWFIHSWCKNASVNNMLGTLKQIHRKINSDNLGDIWSRLVDTSTPTVTFAFLQMDESNGLDDDIYIKMNGRGRKLSAFENLKSWMDERVSTLAYSSEWKSEMDNEWTDLFWKNRNKSQEHPEEIDDEQLFFFYNLLILYHFKTGELQHTITKIDSYMLEELCSFLDMDAKADKNEIFDKVIGKLQKASYFPLLWIERLSLMPKGFFDFALKSTRNIVKITTDFNDMKMYIGDDNKSATTTTTYKLSMCEGSLDRTLPLLYALLSYEEGATTLFDWMRVMRNLILATTIGKDNIKRILESINNYALSCKNDDIYKLISNGGMTSDSSGFNRRQFDEEISKSAWVVEDREWIELFNILESTSFCDGTIGFIFQYLPTQKDKHVFKEYSSLFRLIFEKSGVRNSIPNYLLQRSLMCFTSHYGFGYSFDGGYKWKFMDNREEWHRFLIDSEMHDGQSHNQCMKSLLSQLYDELHNQIDLSNYCEEYASALNCELDVITKQTLNDNSIKDWRYFFIKYPSIWSVMSRSICLWKDNYDIVILGSTQFRDGNIRELRSFAFFNDILDDLSKNPDDYNGWESPEFWPYEDTCMYIKHQSANERTIEINLFYERGKADQYRFKIFYQTNSFENSEVTQTHSATEEELRIVSEMHGFEFQNEDQRYYSPCYSYSDAMSVFKDLIQEFAKY